MARDWLINGETLVKVKGGAHMGIFGSGSINSGAELGLASEAIRISPRFYHQDLHTDDFGPNVPPEVLWQLAEVRINMTLVHFDRRILSQCVAESMGGQFPGQTDGRLRGAGTPLGGSKAIFASGNHYISLNLLSPVEDFPWRFPTTYLSEPPMEFPLGTEKSLVRLNWRAIPYVAPPIQKIVKPGGTGGAEVETVISQFREIVSSGSLLWDHTED